MVKHAQRVVVGKQTLAQLCCQYVGVCVCVGGVGDQFRVPRYACTAVLGGRVEEGEAHLLVPGGPGLSPAPAGGRK